MAVPAMMLAACDIENSHNGDLDGFWHLERVDTLKTGGVTDLRQKRIFWSVQAKLLLTKDLDNDPSGYIFRFSQEGEELILSQPHTNGGHQSGTDDGDQPVTDVRLIAPYGINNLEERFHKDHLNSSHLTLSTDELRLYFKKF